MKELNEFQKWCKEILPVVRAAANGEEIEYLSHTGKWRDRGDGMAETFKPRLKYRIKPRAITVNGFEVPEPMREAPDIGTEYHLADAVNEDLAGSYQWKADSADSLWLSRGICHYTKEAAIAHAKAMLGIDPNGDSK